MKFNTSSLDLGKALKIASEVIEGKNGIQRTKEGLGEAATITVDSDKVTIGVVNLTSDIQIDVKSVYNLEAGQASIRNIPELVKSLKYFNNESETTIESRQDVLQFINGNKKLESTTTNNVINSIDIGTEYEEYVYNSKELYRRIKKLDKLRLKDETRPVLQGILFDSSNLVALDGYRLGITVDDALNVNKEFVIDDVTIRVLLKTLDRRNEEVVTIKVTDKHIRFEYQGLRFTSKLLEGKFLNYKDIIRTDHLVTLKVNTKSFLKDINYMKDVVGTATNALVKLDVSSRTIKSNDIGISGSVIIDGEIESYERGNLVLNDIGFNIKYMQELIKEVVADNITLGFTSSVNPIMIEESDTDKYLLMTVRMS